MTFVSIGDPCPELVGRTIHLCGRVLRRIVREQLIKTNRVLADRGEVDGNQLKLFLDCVDGVVSDYGSNLDFAEYHNETDCVDAVFGKLCADKRKPLNSIRGSRSQRTYL